LRHACSFSATKQPQKAYRSSKAQLLAEAHVSQLLHLQVSRYSTSSLSLLLVHWLLFSPLSAMVLMLYLIQGSFTRLYNTVTSVTGLLRLLPDVLRVFICRSELLRAKVG
jgi:hypothetical protein